MNQLEEKTKFSVVLPIYKVEKYLNRCLDSVMNQTYKNLEIILVDDGSPDNCPQICDDWARLDNRIKVVHKTNAGLGEARNSGLDIATGDYIGFFDSDDYIDKALFEEVFKIIISTRPDLIEFGHYDVDEDGNVIKTFIPKTVSTKFEGKEVMSEFLPELVCTNPKTGIASNLWMSAWSCLYRRQLLVESNFHFVSEREYISEDVYSLMKLMPSVHRVSIMQKAYYFYCKNGQSLTHTYRPDRFEKLVAFQQQLEQLCASNVYDDEVRYRIKRPFLDNLLACMKSEVSCTKKIGVRGIYHSISEICSNKTVQGIVGTIPGVSFSIARRMVHFCIKYKMNLCVIVLIWIQQFYGDKRCGKRIIYNNT